MRHSNSRGKVQELADARGTEMKPELLIEIIVLPVPSTLRYISCRKHTRTYEYSHGKQ